MVYSIVFTDGIFLKIKVNGKIINKTIYIICRLIQKGTKKVYGKWGRKVLHLVWEYL